MPEHPADALVLPSLPSGANLPDPVWKIADTVSRILSGNDDFVVLWLAPEFTEN